MKKKRGTKTERQSWHTWAMVLTAFVVLVSVGIITFLGFYDSYIENVLYKERLNQMQEVTTQLFSGVEDIVQTQWDASNVYCNYMKEGSLSTIEELIAFMNDQASLNELEGKHADLVAVDSLGRYLTKDGWQGMLSEMNYLLDQPEMVSFVSQAMTTDDVFMYFLKRLDEPVVLSDGTKTVTLLYYGSYHSMEELNPYFECEAYDNSNSVYVLDDQGSRLFRSSQNNLLRGYNAYSTLEEMDYLHGTSFDETKHELDLTGHAYSNAILDGEEYYYALYHMENAQWTLLFLVPSSYVAQNVVVLVNTTIKLILTFSIVLLAATTFIIVLILQQSRRRAVEAERSTNKVLTQINGELDQKNTELSNAIKSAEHAMQEATAANRAKSDFLANMSHDIRTPMNAIVGITNLMEHEANLSDRMIGYVQKIKLSSRHLLSLINDVLDMSKIESSEVELTIGRISLAEQVGQVDSIIRSQTNERGQTFSIRTHQIVHEYLRGDGTRLRQIFLNLLSNAVKYTQRGGTISFDIAELPCGKKGFATFRFVVTDNGYGMAPEFLEHIFEPFTRAESSLTNKVQGTGLGMAITKSIVNLMQGTIKVESELNKGSSFEVTITFPIDAEAVYELRARTILLISDDEVLIQNMRSPFSQTSLNLEIVSTKEEANMLLNREEVDIVLLAGHLKDTTLADTVRIMRGLVSNALMIFCVDYAQKDQVQETLKQAGVDGLIARPFFLSNLETAVDRVRSSAAPETQGMSILSGMRFLCAEDNALNAEILAAILEMYGASCTIYPDGDEIVRAFESVKPGEYDAILMDIQMPHMNGYDATRAIRKSKNPLGKTMVIIAMTANAFSDDVQNSLAAGMDAHIAKPIDIALLEKTIRRFAAKIDLKNKNSCDEHH